MDNFIFILAQIMGIISLAFSIISVQFKTKAKITLGFTIACVAMAIQYFLLNKLTGGVVSIANAVRCIVFYLYAKKDKKAPIYVLIFFEILAVVLGILTRENIWSIIPILTTMIYTYGLWQENITITKLTAGIAGMGWAIYDIIAKAYVDVLKQLTQAISATIAIIKIKKKYKKEILIKKCMNLK